MDYISANLNGYYASVDHFGRLNFMLCQNMHQHLTDCKSPGNQAKCLIPLGQLIPEELLNKKGKWEVSISFIPESPTTRLIPPGFFER